MPCSPAEAWRRATAGTAAAAGRAAISASCAQAVALVALVGLGITALPVPENHAYAACAWALLVYAGLHSAIALLCAAFGQARIASGHVSRTRTLELSVARLFSDYSGAATLIVVASVLAPAVIP